MPFVIVRKAQKGYGTNKLIEGVWAKGEKVFVVEDVVTTAKGALGAITRCGKRASSSMRWSVSSTAKKAAARTSRKKASRSGRW